MLASTITACYSTHFKRRCEVVFFKRSAGILLDGEFILFLSTSYICSKFGVSIADIESADSSVDVSEQDIRRLVKLEKKTRTKLYRT